MNPLETCTLFGLCPCQGYLLARLEIVIYKPAKQAGVSLVSLWATLHVRRKASTAKVAAVVWAQFRLLLLLPAPYLLHISRYAKQLPRSSPAYLPLRMRHVRRF